MCCGVDEGVDAGVDAGVAGVLGVDRGFVMTPDEAARTILAD